MENSFTQRTTILPPPLRDDAVVRVTFDAGAVDLDEVMKGVECLQSAGLPVVLDPSACAPWGYLAASDEVRAQEVLQSLRMPHVGALWSARGGYGTMRYLDALPPDALAKDPRWIVGYSDITALHLWANQQGVASLHAPLISGIAKHSAPGSTEPSDELSQAQQILRGTATSSFEGLTRLHQGYAQGRLLGGNLTLLQSLIGTRYLPNLDGVILLIEEIAEPAYRVDRMLMSLRLSGRAAGIRGIVFGDFTSCKGLEGPRLRSQLEDWSRAFECPVVMGIPVGHGERNSPIILGIDYELNADAGTLTPVPPRSATQEPTPQRVRHPVPIPGELGAGWFPAVHVHGGAIANTLTQMLHQGVASAVQLVASKEGEITHSYAMGVTGVLDDVAIAPVTPFTRFDLASVTKAVSTALIAHRLLEDGALSYTTPVAIGGHTHTTVEELLSHRSGLPEWEKFYVASGMLRTSNTDASIPWIQQQLKDVAPIYPDKRCAYSDIGYMILGEWLREQAKEPLDVLFQRYVADPLGLRHTHYRGLAETSRDDRAMIAATEWCPLRERTLQGIVHDENCQLFHGVAGHAGLFSTATDVDRIARSLLGFGPSILRPETVESMWTKMENSAERSVSSGSYTRGWDTPSITPSNAGSLMTPGHTFGHLGYAGTSLWLDSERKIAITLLTNRVHPTRENRRILALRPQIHDLVMRELR